MMFVQKGLSRNPPQRWTEQILGVWMVVNRRRLQIERPEPAPDRAESQPISREPKSLQQGSGWRVEVREERLKRGPQRCLYRSLHCSSHRSFLNVWCLLASLVLPVASGGLGNPAELRAQEPEAELPLTSPQNDRSETVIGALAIEVAEEIELAEEVAPPVMTLEQWSSFLTEMARAHLPHTFRDDKHWGGTTRRWDGVDVERDGWRIETRRKWKEVKHGTWKRYEASLVDPNQEFLLALTRFEPLPDGKLAIEFQIDSLVNVHGQVARWNRGVQLIALSADATARLRLTVGMTLGTRLDLSELPPAVAFEPVVHSAHLELVEFELDRLGHVAGEIAEILGRGAEGMLEEKVSEQDAKLVEKMNRAIDRKRAMLRLSLSDLVQTEWGRLVERHLKTSE